MGLAKRFVRRSYQILEIEGVILLAMLLIALAGAGTLYVFTDFFGNQGPYEFSDFE